MSRRNCAAVILLLAVWSCTKKSGDQSAPANFSSNGIKLNGQSSGSANYNIGVSPAIQFFFSAAIDKSTVNSAFSFTDKDGGAAVAYTASYQNNDQTVVIRPSANLKYLAN
jgi:hypothetical protein